MLGQRLLVLGRNFERRTSNLEFASPSGLSKVQGAKFRVQGFGEGGGRLFELKTCPSKSESANIRAPERHFVNEQT
jgi:hypothetical protein